MTRILLTYILPLVLPALVWYLWHQFRPQRPGEEKKGWQAAPLPQLAVAGLILLVATLGALAVLVGGDPGDVYQPARLIDGRVVPGQHSDAPGGN